MVNGRIDWGKQMVNILLAEIGHLNELTVPGVLPDLAGKTIHTHHATYFPLLLHVHGMIKTEVALKKDKGQPTTTNRTEA